VKSRARTNPSFTKRKRGQQSYQEMQIVEATLVARSASSRWSGDLEISRRSSSHGQRDPTVDEHDVLEPKKK
jgi:hypothetical protein